MFRVFLICASRSRQVLPQRRYPIPRQQLQARQTLDYYCIPFDLEGRDCFVQPRGTFETTDTSIDREEQEEEAEGYRVAKG